MIADEKPILVIGSAGIDIVGRAAAPLNEQTSNRAVIRTSRGGVARNVAENLARLGLETILIAAVGDDANGVRLATQAAECGIDTSHMILAPGERTGSYLALIDEQGFLKYGMADIEISEAITPQVLREKRELFKEAAMVVIDANLQPKTIKTTVQLARSAKVPVCADPTSTTLAERLRPHLQDLYLVTPNPAETAALTAAPPAELVRESAISAAQGLVAAGVKIAAVTMAEFGVGYASREGSGHVPAINTEIVNQTGAGDAFTAAVIFALLNEIPIDEAIRLGVSAATLTLRTLETVVPHLSLELLYDQLAI